MELADKVNAIELELKRCRGDIEILRDMMWNLEKDTLEIYNALLTRGLLNPNKNNTYKKHKY